MSMLQELDFSEARQRLSEVYEQAFVGLNPVLVRRHGKQEVLVIRRDLVEDNLLSAYQFRPEVLPEEDGSVTIALDELHWAVNAPTREEAVLQLVADVKAYAVRYVQQAPLFLSAPDRKGHLPWVLRILLCDSDDEIRRVIGL